MAPRVPPSPSRASSVEGGGEGKGRGRASQGEFGAATAPAPTEGKRENEAGFSHTDKICARTELAARQLRPPQVLPAAAAHCATERPNNPFQLLAANPTGSCKLNLNPKLQTDSH